jgi:hypothetical protein
MYEMNVNKHVFLKYSENLPTQKVKICYVASDPDPVPVPNAWLSIVD